MMTKVILGIVVGSCVGFISCCLYADREIADGG